MPETFQPLDEVSFQSICVEPIEITTAQVGIGAALLLKVISNHQDAVSHGNDGALSTAAGRESLKLGRKITCSLCVRQPMQIGKPCDATRGSPYVSCYSDAYLHSRCCLDKHQPNWLGGQRLETE